VENRAFAFKFALEKVAFGIPKKGSLSFKKKRRTRNKKRAASNDAE